MHINIQIADQKIIPMNLRRVIEDVMALVHKELILIMKDAENLPTPVAKPKPRPVPRKRPNPYKKSGVEKYKEYEYEEAIDKDEFDLKYNRQFIYPDYQRQNTDFDRRERRFREEEEYRLEQKRRREERFSNAERALLLSKKVTHTKPAG